MSLSVVLPKPDPFLPSEVERVGVELVDQFVLSRSAPPVPEGWPVDNRDGWVLGHHPRLPRIGLQAPGGDPIGWILGHPIDAQGRIVKGAYVMPATEEEWRQDPHAALSRTVHELAGRYVLISLPPSISRIYLDPCGSLPAVFCPSEQTVASSVTLIPYSEQTRLDESLTTAIGVVEKGGWFPLGLTCRRGVERLIPNHYLELSRWQVHRYWPGTADLDPGVDLDSAIQRIGDRVTRNILAVAQEWPIHLSLTAGRDTRMILACAREVLDRIELVTINLPDERGQLDCLVASHLARRLNLPHRVLDWVEITERDRIEWLYRTGFAVAGRAMRSVRTLSQLDPRRCILPGFGGEIGRTGGRNLFKDGPRKVTVDFLVDYLVRHTGAGDIPEVVSRARRWVEEISYLHPSASVALYWLEQRLGCWAAPQQHGFVGSAFQLYPFSDRQVLQMFLSLPFRYRTRETVPRKLIAARWPELLQVPFNKPYGFRRYVWEAQRGLARVGRRMRTFRRRGFHAPIPPA